MNAGLYILFIFRGMLELLLIRFPQTLAMANPFPFNFPLDPESSRYVQEFAISLGIGLIIGLEREFSKAGDSAHRQSFAGIRTFALTAIFGYLAIVLAHLFLPWFYLAAFTGLIVLLGLGYSFSAKSGDHGGTSEIALILTFILPALVYFGGYLAAVAVAVILTFILAQKFKIHTLVKQLNQQEILQILLFLVLTALLLPLLPDSDFGPYGIFNLYRNWLVVVIFMGLNFITYFLGKFLAPDRSIIMTGILGGLASSTATAWYFSKHSRNNPGSAHLAATAIILASSLMFVRMLVWLFILNYPLLKFAGLAIGILAITGFAIGFFMYRHIIIEHTPTVALPVGNPVNLKDALIFTAVFLVFRWIVAYAGDHYGSSGAYWASTLAGITDIDAITISLADGQYSNLTVQILSVALLIAALTNTMVKYSLCLVMGDRALRILSSKAFLPLLIIGIIAILVT